MSTSVCQISGGHQVGTEVMGALGVLRRNGFEIRLTVVQSRATNSTTDYIYFCQHDKGGVDRENLQKMLEDVLGPINEHGRCTERQVYCRVG